MHAQEVASRFPETRAETFSAPVRPGEAIRLVTIALMLLFALSVTGIAIALGEAESRPEQRSLLAIGADPRLRRRIAASRAAVLALLAGVLAVPAGLLPVWGLVASRGSTLAVPTLEIVGAVLALPVLAVVSSWLLSRPIPDWNAFRGIGSGE
jgi:putative ABC transport system permease protein